MRLEDRVCDRARRAVSFELRSGVDSEERDWAHDSDASADESSLVLVMVLVLIMLLSVPPWV